MQQNFSFDSYLLYLLFRSLFCCVPMNSEKVSVKSATNLQMHRSIDERLQGL